MASNNEYTYDKRHVLIFRTTSGEMIVGTNDLIEVSNQDWFRDFLVIGRAPRRDMQRDMRDQQETLYDQRQAPPQASPMPRSVPQQQQQSQMRPQTVSQQMGNSQLPRLPTSFLDISPNDMVMQIWESLNAQQQAQWMSRYNIQG